MKTIEKRVAEAKIQCENITAAFANTVYLGQVEFAEVCQCGVQAKSIEGLTIVRVHLNSYLQVAYVEGAQ